jgi:hypothetical protein
LSFNHFDFQRTWWKLFQIHVVNTTFDIYIFYFLTRCRLFVNEAYFIFKLWLLPFFVSLRFYFLIERLFVGWWLFFTVWIKYGIYCVPACQFDFNFIKKWFPLR